MRPALLPAVLYALTLLSTFLVGATFVQGQSIEGWADLFDPAVMWSGWVFAVPLMGILTTHELGHYVMGRRHGVDISPPYFIPTFLLGLGTFGAVIRIRRPIETRNALVDVGASGPLAGLVVALGVLVYGIATSPVKPVPEDGLFLLEGRSLLYLGLLYALKGPIPAGHDIFLSPTAFAGWAGLLVTMINLLPVGQLDGGHVAYALLGRRQNVWSERLRRVLPLVGIAVSLWYGVPSWMRGDEGLRLQHNLLAGLPWLVWSLVLWGLTRVGGADHPPAGPEPLSPARRVVAALTLALFPLLFMPFWLRIQ